MNILDTCLKWPSDYLDIIAFVLVVKIIIHSRLRLVANTIVLIAITIECMLILSLTCVIETCYLQYIRGQFPNIVAYSIEHLSRIFYFVLSIGITVAVIMPWRRANNSKMKCRALLHI